MRKLGIFVATSIISFLMLTSILVAPICAQTAAKSSLQIKKTSANTIVLEDAFMKAVIVDYSNTHYTMIITNQAGTATIFDIIKTDTKSIITMNGVEIPSLTSLPSGLPTLPSLPTNQMSVSPPTTQTSISPSQSTSLMMMTETYVSGVNYYPFDSLNFASGGYGANAIKYPHNDRDYYQISPYVSWSKAGSSLLHCQMDQATSKTLFGDNPIALCGVLGLLIGAPFGVPGAVVGGIIGIALGLAISIGGSYVFFDENGCLWYWLSLPFLNWIASNISYLYSLITTWGPIGIAYAQALILSELSSQGYLRLGNTTALNQIGVKDPTIPQYWVSSISFTYTYSDWVPYSASVSNPTNLVGAQPNGNFATVYAGNGPFNGHKSDQAYIYANLNGEANGHIWINGYSSSGYLSHLTVLVSDDNAHWTQTNSKYQVITSTTAYYIDCGSSSSNFKYICVGGTDDGNSVRLLLDSVQVIH